MQEEVNDENDDYQYIFFAEGRFAQKIEFLCEEL